jgi:hypothetical protein
MVASGTAMAAKGIKTVSKSVVKKALEDTVSFWVPKKKLKDPGK